MKNLIAKVCILLLPICCMYVRAIAMNSPDTVISKTWNSPLWLGSSVAIVEGLRCEIGANVGDWFGIGTNVIFGNMWNRGTNTFSVGGFVRALVPLRKEGMGMYVRFEGSISTSRKATTSSGDKLQAEVSDRQLSIALGFLVPITRGVLLRPEGSILILERYKSSIVSSGWFAQPNHSFTSSITPTIGIGLELYPLEIFR